MAGCAPTWMIVSLLAGATGATAASCSDGDSAVPQDAGADAGDATPPLDSAPAPDGSDGAAACHTVANDAPLIQANGTSDPQPTGAGAGGEIVSGRYFLTSILYYGAELDAGADAQSDGGAATAYPRWWRTTLEVDATLGTSVKRTWKTGTSPTLPAAIEHRETWEVAPVSATTVHIRPSCTDAPLEFTGDYTATPTELVIWVPYQESVSLGRRDTYTKQ